MPHCRRPLGCLAAVGVLLASGCSGAADTGAETDAAKRTRAGAAATPITLAFAGDVHFAGALSGVPARAGSTLGPMSSRLRDADLAMVNLESAVTERTAQADKELEDAGDRYWFKAPASALDVLDRSGVDVASIANNHGADYREAGLRDTLAAGSRSPVRLLGAGLDDAQAFAPYRTTVRGTDVSVLAADASPREGASPTWSAAAGTGPGIARDPARLLAAVRAADARDDLVVVYLHWGEEGNACPTPGQERLSSSLSRAGADVVVGTHAHVPSGAGTSGSTYVSYGLGNFFWYHGNTAQTGVLELSVAGNRVTEDTWVPGRIPPAGGSPQAVTGASAGTATAAWRGLRGCTDLEAGPSTVSADRAAGLTPFTSVVRPINPVVERRMVGRSHRLGCPVPLADLRHLTLSYVGFDGEEHRGELVVNADVVDDVRQAFASMYAARFPIARMQLVDDYGADDDASMAADNTSAYNCRRVAGSSSFSAHAYGRAVDINPRENPYVIGSRVLPASGRAFVDVDRSGATSPGRGVVRDGAVVRRTFTRLGWKWGGDYAEPDFQHFAAR